MHDGISHITRGRPTGRRSFLKAGLAAAAWAGWRRLAGASLPMPPPADAAALFPGVEVFPRHAWTWFDPRPALMRPAYDYTRLTVHHAGTGVNTHTAWDDAVCDLNGILEAHLQNRFGDIAYHFIIDYAGRIWAGRPLCYMGAHVSGFNENNLGIMLLGNFEEQRPAPAQVQSLCALIKAAQNTWRIPAAGVFGHRDLGRSLCPGANLYPLLPYCTTA